MKNQATETLARRQVVTGAPLWLAGSGLLSLGYLEAVRIANGEALSLAGISGRSGFILLTLIGAVLTRPEPIDRKLWRFPQKGAALAAAGLLAFLLYIWTSSTLAASAFLAVLFSLLIALDQILSGSLRRTGRLVVHLVMAGAAGGTAVALTQFETRFSEEEFYAVLQVIVLALLWLILRTALHPLNRNIPVPAPRQPGGLLIKPQRVLPPLGVLVFGAIAGTVLAYQNSFFPPNAPGYGGISPTSPFLCGQASPDTQVYEAGDIRQRLLERVRANPAKQAPEYALLALAGRDESQAAEFKRSLLEEASIRRYTLPTNSVKYGQYEASMRIYFYALIRQAFPDLFSIDEERLVKEWFGAVNARSQTVEWVDWMYALAFRSWPSGPYENQETGAGLLALLEWHGLGDPDLAQANRSYLESGSRGWAARFRNSDDAIIYQPEWINNAYFQSLYSGSLDKANLELAFDWLMLQAPPGGQSLNYNHLGYAHFAIPAYLGASLSDDASLLWLAGRSLDYLDTAGEHLTARPGMETVLAGAGMSPTEGSCLIFGETGVPGRAGPFAPDKIVFRDGWSANSTYLLLNLRFTGWHRYKATNAVVAVFHGEQVFAEQYSGKTIAWLPSGRSLFRDKRIPRENLNGLAVSRSGLSAVLYHLASTGGPWAQDPPFFARVERFESQPGLDVSDTRIENWRGWDHRRLISFYHQGPVVILDEAEGPKTAEAAMFWHTPSGTASDPWRLLLGESPDPSELLLVPLVPGELTTSLAEDGYTVQFSPTQKGEIRLVSILLTGVWVGAQAELLDGGRLLQLKSGARSVDVLLKEER